MVLLCSLSFTVYANTEPTTICANSEHWLSRPVSPDKPVDVFYLYPTVFKKMEKMDENEPNICNLDNPVMLKYSLLAFQGSAFDPVWNIYAPYYRQADAA